MTDAEPHPFQCDPAPDDHLAAWLTPHGHGSADGESNTEGIADAAGPGGWRANLWQDLRAELVAVENVSFPPFYKPAIHFEDIAMHRHLITVATLAGLLGASTMALADRRHWDGGHGHHGHRSHTGVYLDIGPLWWPGYRYPGYGYSGYYSPYYAPSTVVVSPPPATTYVQPPAESSSYWYYCESSRGYYPYVKTCPGGWMKVVPDAPGN
ncbi:MAG: hypothetical protein LJE59_04885 [Chromatiaceae bacterium]|nr:hypothetical protein [Chromatiaceae bacterium]